MSASIAINVEFTFTNRKVEFVNTRQKVGIKISARILFIFMDQRLQARQIEISKYTRNQIRIWIFHQRVIL